MSQSVVHRQRRQMCALAPFTRLLAPCILGLSRIESERYAEETHPPPCPLPAVTTPARTAKITLSTVSVFLCKCEPPSNSLIPRPHSNHATQQKHSSASVQL